MQPAASTPFKPSEKPHTTTHTIVSEVDTTNEGNVVDDTDDTIETTTKRYRVTLTRGLSKYGPWGYLILGMLLCGGALLLCVLWGKHFTFLYRILCTNYLCQIISFKHNVTFPSQTNIFFTFFLTLPPYSTCLLLHPIYLKSHFCIVEILYHKAKLVESSNVSTIPGSSTNANLNGTTSSGDSTMPPNYDEIDPPPSYSTLFPGKSFESTASSATNESTTEAATVTAIPAGSTSQLTLPTVFILPVEIASPTSTTMTRTGT